MLSTPNLIALDNEEAKITIGQNVPFVTGQFTSTGTGGNLNPFQTIERKDVGVTLRVRPQIGENGTIRMTIYQENSSVVASTTSNSNGPTTNKSSVETSVTLDDGQIMVLGGMMKDSVSTGVDKVPGLGDIPLLGNLFRNESRQRTKTTQLVFLRPVVLRDADASSNLTLDRYEAIRAEQNKQQPPHSVIMPINEVPVLPPLPGKPAASTPPEPAASTPAN